MRTQRDMMTAIIGAGSAVRDRDGVAVGMLEQVTFDESSGQLICLVVRPDNQTAAAIELSATLVAEVSDRVVGLTVTAAELSDHVGCESTEEAGG